jgi:hypothetical protein
MINSILVLRLRMVGLQLHSPIRLHGMVLNGTQGILKIEKSDSILEYKVVCMVLVRDE